MIKKIILSAFGLFFAAISIVSAQQQIEVYAPPLIPEVSLYLSPISGSFVEGSTFDVPIIIDTKGQSVNSVEVKIKYDRSKFSIIGPSGKTSIVGVWVEQPVYDNTAGTAKYIGVIPGGITTSSGVISSITFKANSTGQGSISVSNDSVVLLNDGLGTKAKVNFGRSNYNIIPKAAGSVMIFSETHPIQSSWYNNNNPVFAWEKLAGVTGFSYELNTLPGTIPDNSTDTADTSVQYKDLSDGIWYFHIKASKGTIWSQPSSFLVKVDSNPPADFQPTVDYLFDDNNNLKRALVSFFTTDNLSGVARYEVGIIDKNQPTTVSPIFIESESPFQVALTDESNLRVIVRAFDNAGNARESSIDVKTPTILTNILKENMNYIIIGVLLLILMVIILKYLFRHRVLKHLKMAVNTFKTEEEKDNFTPYH